MAEEIDTELDTRRVRQNVTFLRQELKGFKDWLARHTADPVRYDAPSLGAIARCKADLAKAEAKLALCVAADEAEAAEEAAAEEADTQALDDAVEAARVDALEAARQADIALYARIRASSKAGDAYSDATDHFNVCARARTAAMTRMENAENKRKEARNA